jgi:alpha-N-arabinofuranosidase
MMKTQRLAGTNKRLLGAIMNQIGSETRDDYTRRSFLGAMSALGICKAAGGFAISTRGREHHVAKMGSDHNDGSLFQPLKTISAAASRAVPGDTITVHQGVYRERIDPPRGGTSDRDRIVYQAAPGERVEISGAEVVTGWTKVQNDIWKLTLPNAFFGDFNPYNDLIKGDWFESKRRQHHTGAVYVNGTWLVEAASLKDLSTGALTEALWYGQVDSTQTTLWAQFQNIDPNAGQVEINVRQSVFYPSKTGMNYITVRGFILRQAATPWAPPTAEQIGLIGTHWSKGWIIENNIVSHSTCSGIALGKYGDEWDNKSQNLAIGYVDTIERATKTGWSEANIGHHVVRGNTISHCEQAGIVGSLGAIFSLVTGNIIHDVHVRRLFTGYEMAGIKFHAAIDTEISNNVVYRSYRGLWLDWMAQGTHVCRNLFYDNDEQDLFVEVDHGPFLVDHNIFLSQVSQQSVSQGGAYAHNLFCGGTQLVTFDARMTPYMKAHSTIVAGLHNNPDGDMRFFNNIFAQAGDLTRFNRTKLPMFLQGNVFVGKAKACTQEAAPHLLPKFDPKIKLDKTADGYQLEITFGDDWTQDHKREVVTTERLGKAIIPDLPFERADGRPIILDTDYSGGAHNQLNPFPGPFEHPTGGRLTIKIASPRTPPSA